MKSFIKKITPKFILDIYHYLWALIPALFFGFPAKKIKVIGITGTKGKTTTTEIVNFILEKTGYKTALANGVRFKIGDKEWLNKAKMTMSGKGFLQRFLFNAVKNKCQIAVLEITSEGLVQHRADFIWFDIVAFLNLQPEHLEAHGSWEKYRSAKGGLFKKLKPHGISIVNMEDKESRFFLNFEASNKIGFTKSEIKNLGANSIIYPERLEKTDSGWKFIINNQEFILNLKGEFNLMNALAAIAITLGLSGGVKIISEALRDFKGVPGRLEFVDLGQDFKAVVDLAHTPDSFEAIFKTLKPDCNKLICVFGSAGGGRDKWKRPVLGQIAGKYCDYIVLTNEDPYNENPATILENIEAGFSQITNSPLALGLRRAGKLQITKNYWKISDRREAIKKALSLAQKGDCVVFLGKGTEPYMVIGNQKIIWNEAKVVREEWEKTK